MATAIINATGGSTSTAFVMSSTNDDDVFLPLTLTLELLTLVVSLLTAFAVFRARSHSPRMRRTDRLVIAMATTDVITVVLSAPLALLLHAKGSGWLGSRLGCEFQQFTVTWLQLCAITLVTVTSVERTLSVYCSTSRDTCTIVTKHSLGGAGGPCICTSGAVTAWLVATAYIFSFIIAFLPLFAMATTAMMSPRRPDATSPLISNSPMGCQSHLFATSSDQGQGQTMLNAAVIFLATAMLCAVIGVTSAGILMTSVVVSRLQQVGRGGETVTCSATANGNASRLGNSDCDATSDDLDIDQEATVVAEHDNEGPHADVTSGLMMTSSDQLSMAVSLLTLGFFICWMPKLIIITLVQSGVYVSATPTAYVIVASGLPPIVSALIYVTCVTRYRRSYTDTLLALSRALLGCPLSRSDVITDLTSQRRPSNGNSNGKYTSSSSNLTVSRGCADITVSYQPLQHQSLSASSLASLSHGDVEESYTGNNHTSRKLAAYSNQDDSITKGDDDECNHIFFANQR